MTIGGSKENERTYIYIERAIGAVVGLIIIITIIN
jgi:hypothetical protein